MGWIPSTVPTVQKTEEISGYGPSFGRWIVVAEPLGERIHRLRLRKTLIVEPCTDEEVSDIAGKQGMTYHSLPMRG
jgi:hypothetical protein